MECLRKVLETKAGKDSFSEVVAGSFNESLKSAADNALGKFKLIAAISTISGVGLLYFAVTGSIERSIQKAQTEQSKQLTIIQEGLGKANESIGKLPTKDDLETATSQIKETFDLKVAPIKEDIDDLEEDVKTLERKVFQ